MSCSCVDVEVWSAGGVLLDILEVWSAGGALLDILEVFASSAAAV